MTNILFSQILSLMTAFVMPDAAAAGPGARQHHGDRGAGMCERLECTDAQRARIDAIRAEHRQEMTDERAEAKRLREALKAERAAASPDAEKIAALQAQLDALKTTMKQARQETKTEISAVLTPEQRERLGAMKAKHQGKAHRGGKGKAHRGGKDEARRGGEGKGKAHAKAERGAKGKAHAKAERGAKGKANAKGLTAKRERPSKERFTAG